MPEIKLQHIVSYSSQDTNHPAENLLKPDGFHKWKSASAGEKSLSAILQFEKASKIHSIDIGNDGSAFVEVLVGRSSSHNDDFKVILVTSSFMSPMESRNNKNRYSVRMFGSDKLSKPATEEKWDRVKIICTQPFNKINPKKIGAFFFRQGEEDKKDLKVGSLFARQKDKPESSPLTGAAAIRAASNQARSTYLEMKSSTSTNSTPEVKKKRKHNISDDEDVLEVKKSKSKNGDSHRSHMPQNDRPTHQKEDSRKEKKSNSSSRDDVKSTPSSSSSSSNSHKNSHHKSETTTSKAAISKSNKPFSKIMDNVVFVLSGFQNPFRADLRDKAREMGAKYRPDWSSDCTHLVCAFANTPKYNMVKGQGRIVTKQWVLDCHKQRTLLPWRKYQLEDEEEEDEKADKGQVKDEGKKQKKEKEKKGDDEEEEEEEQHTQVIDEEEDYSQQSRLSKSKSDPEYLPSMEDRESTDEEEEEEEEGVVSEEDTDDEVRRIKNAANIQSESSSSSDAGPSRLVFHAADTLEINRNVDDDDDDDDNNDHDKNNNSSDDDDNDDNDDDDDDDAFGAATDVDEDKISDSDSELPILPDFFSDKHFFLYGNFDESERHKLTRYIIAYNGEVEDYMNDNVNFVVTSEQWDDNFDEALSNYPQLTFVHPKWLYSCHMKNKWVPYQLHIVTPASE
ncbi:DNA repair protein XRCC1 isoform X2 [Octopus bimaculoides]|uniref:DNA repair protein XRCC1 isoform X2 n=1 Tax=Octopus bimaculoides TaxID=37653 RepID=UPI00071CAAA7|nr:DNA repair protein XRCC1 isoform X2 [Octopus bimaculoides]|eukprot:XP_014788399.1 PREDICTED: DNA repair protein XRCC1-like isoform X2 [Octopus bimaculoides]